MCVCGLGKEPTSFSYQGHPALYQVLPVCRSEASCFCTHRTRGISLASISPGEGTGPVTLSEPELFQSTGLPDVLHRAQGHLPTASRGQRERRLVIRHEVLAGSGSRWFSIFFHVGVFVLRPSLAYFLKQPGRHWASAGGFRGPCLMAR